MGQLKIGIPRSIHYFEFKDKWEAFFNYLGCKVVTSPPTNKEILQNGINYSNDEMCLSLKLYLGHVNYLKDKCDYIIVPRIDNYDINNQTCTNFLALYDIVNNIFDIKILNYNIDYENNETEKKGFYKMGRMLKFNYFKIKKAYDYACNIDNKVKHDRNKHSLKKLKGKNLRILIVSHSYIIHDQYLGVPIVKCLEKLGADVIYSDELATQFTNQLSSSLSNTLYWKYSRDQIGVIELVKKKIDGVIFLTSFPCGLDSLVNELVIRKIKLPCINIVIDDLDSLTGIETRLESFIDILEGVNNG
ncbi:MAG: hypothetical protein IJ134_01315 [Bacilli bacterium]|nr:hypothetical protein [Bacilli bacterium]